VVASVRVFRNKKRRRRRKQRDASWWSSLMGRSSLIDGVATGGVGAQVLADGLGRQVGPRVPRFEGGRKEEEEEEEGNQKGETLIISLIKLYLE
jgi:hypothetical protein